MSEDYDRLKKQYDELVAKNETRRLIAPVRRGYEDGYAAGYAAALAAPPSPEALPAMLEGEYPPVLGDWLWGQLMAWCKKRGCAPASFDDLFAIVGRMRTYVDSDRASRAQAAPAPIDMVMHCPACGMQHIDASDAKECAWPQCSCADQVDRGCIAQDISWTNPPHRSHLCHGCGHIWRPADVPTNGVQAADPLAVPCIKLSATAQVRMCGNSVAPAQAEALVRANFAHESRIYGRAAA